MGKALFELLVVLGKIKVFLSTTTDGIPINIVIPNNHCHAREAKLSLTLQVCQQSTPLADSEYQNNV